MAKKAKKAAKTAAKTKAAVKKVVKKTVKKVLDSTDLDEKIVAEYNDHKNVYDTILGYGKCYGGYVLAVGAGCTFGASFIWGTILLAAAAGWAWNTKCTCKSGNNTCCKN